MDTSLLGAPAGFKVMTVIRITDNSVDEYEDTRIEKSALFTIDGDTKTITIPPTDKFMARLASGGEIEIYVVTLPATILASQISKLSDVYKVGGNIVVIGGVGPLKTRFVPETEKTAEPKKSRPRPYQSPPLIPPGSHIEQGKDAPGSTNVIGNNNQIGSDLTRPIVTYAPNGMTTTVGPSGVVFGGPGDPTNDVYQSMVGLEKQRDWEKLASTAEAQIRATPTWLTPYAFSGEAYIHLNQPEKGIERLDYFIGKASVIPEYHEHLQAVLAFRKQVRQNVGK